MLDRTDVADVSVPSFPIVEALDIVKNAGPGFSPGLVLASPDTLKFECGKEALHNQGKHHKKKKEISRNSF